jgi:Mg2+-importing ATPase
VIRTRRPIFRSRPGRYLRLSTLLVVCCALAVPFTPLAGVFGFVRLPATFLAALGVILLLYVGSAEVAKKLFYRYIHVSTRPGTDGGVRRPAQQHDR